MRLAKIKNKYLFESDNPEGTHTYAVYYDRKSKEYRAVALTHLYVKDKKRFWQVKIGNIKVEKFSEFETPSGVHNYFYAKNVKGGKIDIKDKKNVVNINKKYLPKAQADRIKDFAAQEYKRRTPQNSNKKKPRR